MEYYLKIYILLQIKDQPKMKVIPEAQKFLSALARYLHELKDSIGNFESNRQELKDFMIIRLQACNEDYKNDNLYPDLYENFLKLSKMILILTLFKANEDEKKKINTLSLFIRQIN